MRRVFARWFVERTDGAAVAVPAHDDVFDSYHDRRELDSRGRAVIADVLLERRHERADVSDDEQLARQRVGEEIRDHTGIRAAEKQRVRLLAVFNQTGVVVSESGEEVTAERCRPSINVLVMSARVYRTTDYGLRTTNYRRQATGYGLQGQYQRRSKVSA